MQKLKITTIAILGSLLYGCTIFPMGKDVYIHEHELSSVHNASEIKTSTSCATNFESSSLQIMPVLAEDPYASLAMLYSLKSTEIHKYSAHQWASPPAVMIAKAFERYLSEQCGYKNISLASNMITSKYRLVSTLIELKQEIDDSTLDKSNSSTVKLAILIQLVDNQTNKIVKAKLFNEELKTAANPEAYAKASNEALNNILEKLVEFLKEE